MSQREGVFVVQFATALNPINTPLRIVTALCADVLQGLLFFLGWPFR